MIVFAHVLTDFMISLNQIGFNQHFLWKRKVVLKMLWNTRILITSIICIVKDSM
jgi:hypothetical protein